MQLEIAPQHHLFIIGRAGANIKQIMQRTGAQIHFPDPNTSPPQRRGTVIITGAIESVFLARQHLIVSLPFAAFQSFLHLHRMTRQLSWFGK
jgi:protein bicaudal C